MTSMTSITSTDSYYIYKDLITLFFEKYINDIQTLNACLLLNKQWYRIGEPIVTDRYGGNAVSNNTIGIKRLTFTFENFGNLKYKNKILLLQDILRKDFYSFDTVISRHSTRIFSLRHVYTGRDVLNGSICDIIKIKIMPQTCDRRMNRYYGKTVCLKKRENKLLF